MKAKIYSQKVYASMLDLAHDEWDKVIRIVFPEADNLWITFHNGNIYAETDGSFDSDKDVKLLGEIELPDMLVKIALPFIHAKRLLLEQQAKIESMIKDIVKNEKFLES